MGKVKYYLISKTNGLKHYKKIIGVEKNSEDFIKRSINHNLQLNSGKVSVFPAPIGRYSIDYLENYFQKNNIKYKIIETDCC